MRTRRSTAPWLLGIALLGFTGFFQQLPGQSKIFLPGEKLPSVEFNRTDFGSALEYLRARANEMLGKNGRSLNLVLIDPDGEISKKPITLNLTDVPWATALKYTCDLAGVILEADYGTLVIGSKEAVHKLRHSRSRIRHSPGSTPLVHQLGVIPMTDIEFKGSQVKEIVEFLNAKTQPAAPGNTQKTPVNLIIKESATRPVADRPVNLTLAKAPLSEVLHFATGLAGCRYRIDANAVVIGDDEDLKRVPRPKIADRGAIYQRLISAPVSSVEIAKGTSLEDLATLIRHYSKDPGSFPEGINVLDSTGEKLTTWSVLKLENVRLIDLIQYINELSGTTFSLEKNALVLIKDPYVTKRPDADIAPIETTNSGTGGLRFDP